MLKQGLVGEELRYCDFSLSFAMFYMLRMLYCPLAILKYSLNFGNHSLQLCQSQLGAQQGFMGGGLKAKELWSIFFDTTKFVSKCLACKMKKILTPVRAEVFLMVEIESNEAWLCICGNIKAKDRPVLVCLL